MLPLASLLALAMCVAPLPPSGGPTRRGDESIMRPKQHGTSAEPVQGSLHWGVSRELAVEIACFNREGAEGNMYFTECRDFTAQLGWQRGDAGVRPC